DLRELVAVDADDARGRTQGETAHPLRLHRSKARRGTGRATGRGRRERGPHRGERGAIVSLAPISLEEFALDPGLGNFGEGSPAERLVLRLLDGLPTAG